MCAYKLIACDLDETLISTDGTISRENREAIAAARELGVRFVPCTGRGYASIRTPLEDLGLLDAEGEYAVSFNGGCITENHGNRVLYYHGLDFDVAERLWKRGMSYEGICIHVYTQDAGYVWRFNEEERRYLEGRQVMTPVEGAFSKVLAGKDVAKVLFQSSDMSYLNAIERDMADSTRDLAVSYSANRYLEFNPGGVDKGSGLAHLAALLGVKLEETIAIGDNWNDCNMLKTAGLGACVANAVDAMKPVCDYVCSATCDESAVAEVIRTFVFA